ncbi:hypothetical protein N7509_002265 [Penicillium cosmopolitanum]|uniref:CCZ1/INTU/HSP4 first Longin domain-containing protein n=1 Tax=Penicillium cosmopolitanum TaxID=1131564 RepID=A0A9W9W8P6_9EURO|nr:uncharacterized protein N7509_002265 [Penicillium cosmopolitanum]KAJ5408382.1 hypothetical protein N7509_002265 [Penicillium cosmopolitanum]
MPESDSDSVIPAQLSFLAIYNPTLGPTDETLEDQIVFYTSRADLQREDDSATTESGGKLEGNDKNERLRQIGLAQGMVNFASNFSPGKPLEYVETDKARFILVQLEQDWWAVASIDLTRLPADPNQTLSSEDNGTSVYQYSAREMGPPQLFLQQLRRAHSLFLLHHDFSLDALYERVGRSVLCLFLERFWEKFAWNWELLLTGNPIVEIYNGIKLAAGGELGVGVGEEEWGSGEREVLEDFVARTDGLLDLVVSRFGEPAPQPNDSPPTVESNSQNAWLGSDQTPRPADGVVFSGLGAVSRLSLARVSHWMEWIYRYGDTTYGVGRDPASLRRRKPRRRDKQKSENATASPQNSVLPSTPEMHHSHTPGIPRPLVIAAPQPQPTPDRQKETNAADGTSDSTLSTNEQGFGTETVMKYLTLGYGSAWSFSKSNSPSPDNSTAAANESTVDSRQQSGNSSGAAKSSLSNEHRNEPRNNTSGRFILGPRDDLNLLDDLEEESPAPEAEASKPKSRIIHRFIHIHTSDESSKKLQAVIYVNQPFVFTFLFDPETPSLSSPTLYTSIHHQLGPLQKPLLASTSPATAAARIPHPDAPDTSNRATRSKSQSLYDFVYDPSNLTIRSSIPNIPSLGSPSSHHRENNPRTPSPSQPKPSTPLSRIESLAIHHRLLTTYTDTRSRPLELERTCKTSRGWWIIWVRIPQTQDTGTHTPSPAPLSTTSSSAALSSMAEGSVSVSASIKGSIPESPQAQPQEAFLVRKAVDYVSPGHARVSSGARFFRDLGGASSSKFGSGSGSGRADTTPSKLVEGIGMDARRYIEGLLRFNR